MLGHELASRATTVAGALAEAARQAFTIPVI